MDTPAPQRPLAAGTYGVCVVGVAYERGVVYLWAWIPQISCVLGVAYERGVVYLWAWLMQIDSIVGVA